MKHYRLFTAIIAILMLIPAQGQIQTARGKYATNPMNDIVGLYYGASWRLKFTPDQLQPYVIHKYVDGHVDWLFPGFTFIEFVNNHQRYFIYKKN